MNGAAARFVRVGGCLSGLVLLAWILTGQAAKPAIQRVPLPTDWSHRHAIFSQPQTPEEYARVANEPRYWQQLYRRGAVLRTLPVAQSLAANISQPAMHRDWSVNLGASPTAPNRQGTYPAKYGFDVTKASCTDFAVYGTGLQSTSSQAAIVGFTNLYSGCPGSPTVSWAYNTGDIVTTSPIISLDGTQVAFVEDNGSVTAEMVLLKPQAGTGTLASPRAPTSVSASNYPTCTAPCMIKFPLMDGLFAADDTISSVFYDYTDDIIWVGDSGGLLHKFTPVFKGIPAEVTTAPWPLKVSSGNAPLSSPLYDRNSGNVIVGDLGGFLYLVNASTGAIIQSGQLDFGTGLVDAPIVDSTKGLLYVFASSDASGACALGTTFNCAAVYQLSTTFAGNSTGTEVTLGDSGDTPNPMYIGAFDSAYFGSANRTGNLYVCGETGANPTLYQVPITAGAFPGSGAGTIFTTLAPAVSTAACSPVTDITNPNTVNGASERIFVSVQNNGSESACTNHGCVFNFVVAPWKPSTSYVIGQEVLSPNFRVQTVIAIAGNAASGTSGATAPGWATNAGTTKTDNQLTWLNQGILKASNLPAWHATTSYPSTASRILDPNGYVEISTTPGTSGASPGPTWPTTAGATTPDGSVVWTNAGKYGTFALSSTGGTSGIIEDNVSVGTITGTSQVYFSTLGNQTCGSGGSGSCAVQASQPGLN